MVSLDFGLLQASLSRTGFQMPYSFWWRNCQSIQSRSNTVCTTVHKTKILVEAFCVFFPLSDEVFICHGSHVIIWEAWNGKRECDSVRNVTGVQNDAKMRTRNVLVPLPVGESKRVLFVIVMKQFEFHKCGVFLHFFIFRSMFHGFKQNWRNMTYESFHVTLFMRFPDLILKLFDIPFKLGKAR